MNEALVQSYTLPYIRLIREVKPDSGKIYLYTFEKKGYKLDSIEKNKLKKSLEEEGIFWKSSTYYRFGVFAFISMVSTFFKLITFILFKRINVIHAWCTPAGSLGWLLSFLTRRTLVIDSYEPHAESMVENGSWSKKSIAYKILIRLEKFQTKRAIACIGLTSKTPEYSKKSYGVTPKQYFIKPACVDFELFKLGYEQNFSLIDEPDNCDKIIMVYAGKIGGIYLDKEIFEFILACNQFWKNKFKAVILTDTPTEIMLNYQAEYSLSKEMFFFKKVDHKDVPNYLALGSFALNPVKPVPSKRYCTSIKDGEYWAMGLPVVITKNISDDSEIISENKIGAIIESFDQYGYSKAISDLDEILLDGNKTFLSNKIKYIAVKYRNFDIAKNIYSKLYGTTEERTISFQPRKILALTTWSYNDALIQTYTLPYLEIISNHLKDNEKIYLVTLEKDRKQSIVNPNPKIEVISFKYLNFNYKGLLMWTELIIYLSFFIKRKKINTIHSFCTPAGGLAYILSWFNKSRIILDSFEPHAEPMVETKTWRKNSYAFKILFWLEKKQLKRANEVICAVNGMINYSKAKYNIVKERYFSKPACIDLNQFSYQNIKNPVLLKELGIEEAIVCVYAGKFGGLYLEKETFDFFKIAYDYYGNRFKVLLLTSHSEKEIARYAKKSNLPLSVIIQKYIKHSEIADYMGLADFAICPMKPVPSRRFGTPIKNGEYWALGLPVVITKDISDDSDIIQENEIGAIIDKFDDYTYEYAIDKIDYLIKNNTREEIYKKIRPIAEKYRNFEIAEKIYSEIYR